MVIAERISARLWMRDLFSQCTCVRTCLSRSGMSICAHVHAQELMRHTGWLTRIPDALICLA